MLCHGPNLLSAIMTKTKIKTKLERKSFMWLTFPDHRPPLRSQDRTQAETPEQCCLLAHCPYLAQAAFFYNSGPLASIDWALSHQSRKYLTVLSLVYVKLTKVAPTQLCHLLTPTYPLPCTATDLASLVPRPHSMSILPTGPDSACGTLRLLSFYYRHRTQ